MSTFPDDAWSAVADDWGRHWGTFARPVWEPMLRAAQVGSGTRVLDVGCGSGELLEHLQERGARPSGVDPASRMVELARARAVGADVRSGHFERLPFDDGAFEAVLAVNALQFAADQERALAEARRVLTPGGVVGVAGWAERARNDLDALNNALAEADEDDGGVYDGADGDRDGHDGAHGDEPDDPPEDGPLRVEGGLTGALRHAGWDVVGHGIEQVPWTARDDRDLTRGILFGDDAATIEELGPVVLAAAEPFRRPDGSYRLVNAFRWAVARVPG